MIVGGLIVFVAVSAVLGRIFTVDGAEQAAVTALLIDEAHGNAAGVIARIDGCGSSAACRAKVTATVAKLHRSGDVVVVNYTPSSGFSLSSTNGVGRVAYTIGNSMPIVQCLRIHRSGNPITGVTIHLRVLSRRIAGGADCPKHF